MTPDIFDEAVTVDSLIAEHAAHLQQVYNDRTAGDHTFVGALANFLSAALPVLNTAKDEPAEVVTEYGVRIGDEDYVTWYGPNPDMAANGAALSKHPASVVQRTITTSKWVTASLGVSGEDQPEPTPAPRDPRVWREGDPAPTDASRFRDDEDDEWTIHFIGQDGQPWLHMADTPSFPWSGVLKMCGQLTEVLPEVVIPEGTS